MRIFKILLLFLLSSIAALPFENDNDNSDNGISKNDQGRSVSIWNKISSVNPEEVLIDDDNFKPINLGRHGITNESRRWPNNTVPYKVIGLYDAEEMEMLQQAMDTIQFWTCIRFVKHNRESDYLVIKDMPGFGCKSKIGFHGGRQLLVLESPECFIEIGTIIHELLHVLGIIHEHNRPDRDLYITVNATNLRRPAGNQTYEKNYGIYTAMKTYDYGAPYDYNSVMHYSTYSGSINGEKTIEPKSNPAPIGQRKGLSVRDVIKLMNMYHCYYKINNTAYSSSILPNANETRGLHVELWDTFFRNSKPVRNPEK